MPAKKTSHRSKVKNYASFLKELETRAREYGLTLLSKDASVHPTYFSHMFSEKGNPTLESVTRIAEALGYVIELRKKG